LVWFTLGL